MLRVSGISVRFGEHQAVHDVDLSVPTGTIVGLIGPIGAGKTTTFKAICGVQPCEGTVTISDVDRRTYPHKRAVLGLGRTFQRLEVFGSKTRRTMCASPPSCTLVARSQSALDQR